MTIAAEIHGLFDRAEGIYVHCRTPRAHNRAAQLYLRGADLLPEVPHPLDYLELVIRQTRLLRQHVMPNMLAL